MEEPGAQSATDTRAWLSSRRMTLNPFEWLQPVDFSFLRLAAVTEVVDEEPRTETHCPRIAPETHKFIATTVKFNNNHISELQGLPTTLDAILFDRNMLTWLDLSFNTINTVDAPLTCLTSLQILYLHANQLPNLQEVAKLAELRHLRSLTLHGNPLEEATPMYRTQVLLLLPWLRRLDFSLVTRRDLALMHYNLLPKSKPRRKRDVN